MASVMEAMAIGEREVVMTSMAAIEELPPDYRPAFMLHPRVAPVAEEVRVRGPGGAALPHDPRKGSALTLLASEGVACLDAAGWCPESCGKTETARSSGNVVTPNHHHAACHGGHR
ncbi:MAG: hypothetical protein L0027_02200, partial [Candidatus Rokubacteria bacterium]|nr:hypothetical protein [Candidatus Rokubacteria bacterium]